MWAEKLDTTGKTWHLSEKSVISSWEHHPITGGSSSVDETGVSIHAAHADQST